MNPDFRAQSRVGHDRVTQMEVVDNYTLRIRLKEIYAPYINTWIETFIVPEHILVNVKDLNTSDFNSKPVGTGPFKLEEWVRGDHLTFAANPNYHRSRPPLISLSSK